jgi:patatin-like phospholipase/acyl hydrolase
MVIAVKDNSASRAPYIFRTYNHEHAGEFLVQNAGTADNVLIVDVARATTAAPTYFKEKVINGQKFLDGGFGTNANNPSQIAYHEVLLMHGNNPQAVGLLVSIGTGKLRNLTPFPRINSIYGKYKAAISYAVHAASDAEDTHQKMMLNMAAIDRPYERFNVDGGLDHIKLDDWKTISQRSSSTPVNVTLKTIEDGTKAYLRQKDVQVRLEETALMLVKNRQERSKTTLWDFAATGSRYYCSVKFCHESSTPYNSEELLRQHLITAHANVGFRYTPSTDEEKTMLEKTIQQGKIPHAD